MIEFGIVSPVASAPAPAVDSRHHIDYTPNAQRAKELLDGGYGE